jgi:hypothetical protein
MARKRQATKTEASPVVDPRRGDIEDDASSTKRRSMLSLAGSLLVEISLPKLIFAWAMLLVLSERIGTALINGNWFVRSLQSLSGRAILMHGHRHIDWIGECAGLPIVSAALPSHGGHRRHGHLFLYPYSGGRGGWAAQAAVSRAHDRTRHTDPRRLNRRFGDLTKCGWRSQIGCTN